MSICLSRIRFTRKAIAGQFEQHVWPVAEVDARGVLRPATPVLQVRDRA